MIRFAFLAAIFALATTTGAGAADYVFDPPHTQVTFSVSHLTISKVSGSIPLAAGAQVVALGANDLPTAGTITFDVTKLDSGDEHRNASLTSSYLETAKYPTMTFVIRKVDGTPQAFTMTGDLTLHGVTKSIVLKGSVLGTATIRGKRQVGYTASTTIDRRDFGITFGPVLDGALIAGYDVAIEVEAAVVAQTP
jgi:polyisoprenoid-binding protein YceI